MEKKLKKKQTKNCVRRWLVHIPDHRFQQMNGCTGTNSFLEATRCYQRQFPNQKTVQTNINGQVCQYGLRLNKNVSNRGCHYALGSTLSKDSYHMKKKSSFNRISNKDLTYYSDGKGTSVKTRRLSKTRSIQQMFNNLPTHICEGYFLLCITFVLDYRFKWNKL